MSGGFPFPAANGICRYPDALFSLLFQEFLDFQRGHATGAGGGNRLAIAAILHVSAGVDAMNAREDIVVSLEVTIRIGVELPGKHLRIGIVADAKKQGAGREIPSSVRLHIA